MSPDSYMLFEAGRLFAIALAAAQEVIVPLPSTPVPHRPHPGFLGLVDWQGRVEPCVCLTRLLNIDSSQRTAKKMIVLSLRGETIVCPVDRVLGIKKLPQRALEVVAVGKAGVEDVAKGFFPEIDAILLDEDKLLNRVREALTCCA